MRMVGGAGVLFIIGLLAGCGSEAPRSEPDASLANLLGIHTAYVEYVSTMRKPPRTIKDLEMPFAEEDRQTLDKRFRSPHDGKPYVVIWGLMLASDSPPPVQLLAHEADGVKGERWVLMTDASCKRLRQEEFDKLKKTKR